MVNLKALFAVSGLLLVSGIAALASGRTLPQEPPQHTGKGISLPPQQLPVKAQTERLTRASGEAHQNSREMDALTLFISAKNAEATKLRGATAAVLSDSEWVSTWKEPKEDTFVLERRKRTKADKHETWKRQQLAAANRYRYLGNLSRDEIERLSKQYPMEAGYMRSDKFRARAQLLNAISDFTLNQALAGQPVDLSVGEMSAEFQGVIRAAIGGGYIVQEDPGKKPEVLFDPERVATSGTIRLYLSPNPNGMPELYLGLLDKKDGPISTFPVGQSSKNAVEDLKPALERASKLRQERQGEELDGVASDVEKVTIRRLLTLNENEAPLGAYLKEFVRQTGITVVATWPQTKWFERKLPENIVAERPGAALNTLANAYGCVWVLRDGIVQFRLPYPEMEELTEEYDKGWKRK